MKFNVHEAQRFNLANVFVVVFYQLRKSQNSDFNLYIYILYYQMMISYCFSGVMRKPVLLHNISTSVFNTLLWTLPILINEKSCF